MTVLQKATNLWERRTYRKKRLGRDVVNNRSKIRNAWEIWQDAIVLRKQNRQEENRR